LNNLLFKHVLALFKIENVIWFWHDIPRTHAEIIQKKSGRSRNSGEFT
jgi:hypothetical protein